MMKVFNMIKTQSIYKLVEQPLDTNIIMTKWVYALKFDGDSKISNKKTKIVVQEFLQI